MTTQAFGRDQSYARKVNNELVIQKLRKEDLSATELSSTLNLSHAAMSSILKGLLGQGIIKVSCSKSEFGKGRKQVVYSLNEQYGLIIVVSLSDNRYSITISNIKEEILVERVKEIDKYDVSIIYEIVLCIKDLLANNEYRDIPLKNIIISVPGRVNSITGELQLSKQFDKNLFEGKNVISSIFENYFQAPIYIQNDINLSIIGEMKCGRLSNVSNAMIAYIDNGMGGAMVFNNSFYVGEEGYAGELGLMSANFRGEETYLDEFASLRSIKNYASSVLGRKFTVSSLITEYQKKGDIYDYVIETAHLVGKKLRDLVEVLNISNIVLSGRVVMFGQDYLDAVKEELSKAKNQCKVEYSELGKNSILIGAISKSVDQSIAHMSGKDDE